MSSSQSATVTATLSGQSQQAILSLSAVAAQLSGLTCSPASVTGPGTSTCTATLTAAASSAASVTLSSNNTSVTVPGSVNIGAGLSSATFTATVAAVTSNQTALLTATLNGGSKTFTLTAKSCDEGAAQVAILLAYCDVQQHVSAKCTVTLNAAATTDSVVSIASSSALLSVPASVTVPAGQSSATFDAISGTVSASQNADGYGRLERPKPAGHHHPGGARELPGIPDLARRTVHDSGRFSLGYFWRRLGEPAECGKRLQR